MRIAIGAACAVAAIAAAIGAASADESSIKAGQALFDGNCHRCHSPTADKKSYGPPLEGVVGRKAGSVPGFTYSKALANANFVWTPDELKAWMADNDRMVPGTKMRHVGITDHAEQDLIVTYLETLKD
jgi:cytochrome c